MLITEKFSWDHPTFEAYLRGMCHIVQSLPSRRIAFLAHPTPEVILTFFALWKTGKIACPLNPKLPSIQLPLKELEATLFTPKMPTPSFSTDAYKEWDLKQPATLLFTSGSTGRPKVALHTLANHVYSAMGSNELIPLDPSDKWALTLPLFHVSGIAILFRSYLAKSSILLSLKDVKTATHLSLVPTQLHRLKQQMPQLPLLKLILLGGAPIPENISVPWKILPTYGMTEMSSQIVTDNLLHPYTELQITSDQQIWVRGKTLFQGYLDLNGQPQLPLNDKGWFVTRDLGRWEKNRLIFLGRQDHLFISGGENIHPEEIEEMIRRVCGLEENVVVPLDDEEFGTRPALFLKEPLNLKRIQEALQLHLPKYKIPVAAFALPENDFKPNRRELIEIAASHYRSQNHR